MMFQKTTAVALAGIGAWIVFAAITWAVGAPFGHDESQYAIAARDMLAGEEPRWFFLSRGMSVVAAPGIWLGASERALRLAPLLLGVGFIVAAYVLARRIVGAASAAWAVVVLASSAKIARLSTDLLSDLPAAACLLAAVAVIVDEVDREGGARWRLVLAAPLLAAALYLRYGSAVPIAVIIVASIAVGARTLARRPQPAIATALVFCVLLVPHFLDSHATTGSPLGILLESRTVPQQQHIADGLVTYLTSNPFVYYGWLTPFVLVAGVLALRMRDRRRLLAWLIGVGSLVAMGLTTHGMLRYIVFSVAILVILGTDQVRHWLAMAPPRLGRTVSIALALTLAAIWLLIASKRFHADDYRQHRMRGTLAAAKAIRADAAGAPCTVIGYHSTQLEWYSGCSTRLALDPGEAHRRDERVYLVRDHTPTWAPMRQPVFSEFLGSVRVLAVEPFVVEVARLDPPR